MGKHHYGHAPNGLADADAAKFYREPLPAPHAVACRAYEPGLVRVPGKKESNVNRLYCFGASPLAGQRVCDVNVNDYSRLHDTAKGYDTYELYGKQFGFIPFYHTSVWTAKVKGITKHHNFGSPAGGAVGQRTQVTAMSQGGWNRLDQLAALISAWQGPVSFALLLDSRDQLSKLDAFLARSEDVRTHLDLHVAWRVSHSTADADAFFPINMLRNMALQPISSGHVLVIDVDNIPNTNMTTYCAWVERAELAVRNASEHQVCLHRWAALSFTVSMLLLLSAVGTVL